MIWGISKINIYICAIFFPFFFLYISLLVNTTPPAFLRPENALVSFTSFELRKCFRNFVVFSVFVLDHVDRVILWAMCGSSFILS